MKIDLADLKAQIETEMSQLEQRIQSLTSELKQLEAVEEIAKRMDKRDPVDEALKELKKVNGKAEPVEEVVKKTSEAAGGENLEWAFQN